MQRLDPIQAIIAQATPESIACAKVKGLEVSFSRENTSNDPTGKLNQHIDLFSTLDATDRMSKMRKLFPQDPQEGYGIDQNALRCWLRDVYEIIGWEKEEEVRSLLGVPEAEQPSSSQEKIKNEANARDNKVMDDLDEIFAPSLTQEPKF